MIIRVSSASVVATLWCCAVALVVAASSKWVSDDASTLVSAFASTEVPRPSDASVASLLRQPGPTRVLFLGDSQTRYLFVQFVNRLRATVPEWTSVPAPSLDTRFSFSWLSKVWTTTAPSPFARVSQSNRSQVEVAFLVVEYASTQPFVLHMVDLFDPTAVVVGRGCWDLIWRVPFHNSIQRMVEEAAGLLRYLQSRASIRSVSVLPVLRLGFIKRIPVGEQRRKSPWTACVVEHIQELFWLAVAVAASCPDSSGVRSLRRVTILEAVEATSLEDLRPDDGFHYRNPIVKDRVLRQLLQAITTERGFSSQARAATQDVTGNVAVCSNATTERLTVLLNARLRANAQCLRARARFERVVNRDIVVPVVARARRLAVAGGGDVVGRYLSCLDAFLALWRYLGPLPWTHSAHAEAQALMEWCAGVRTRIMGDVFLRNRTLTALLALQYTGAGGVCKSAAFGLLSDFPDVLSLRPAEVQWDLLEVNCLTEPFGARP